MEKAENPELKSRQNIIIKKMKNFLLAFIAISMLVIACTKQEEFLSASGTKSTEATDRVPHTITITISWEEWGRAKYGCERNGLCNFHMSTDGVVPVQQDDDGNLFVDILIDETYPTQYGIEVFPVDEDITATFEGAIYRMPAGQYPLNPGLGNMGGYRVPLLQE